MSVTYVVRDSSGAEVRVMRLPEGADPADQLQPGETATQEDRPRAAPAFDIAAPITEESLIAGIDAQREAKQMAVMTAGGAKKYVYNRKAVEAIDARGVLAATLNALSLTDKQKRFPFATAESALTGEQLSVVLARFDTAMVAASAKIAAIEAQAQRAKRAVRAASTMAAKQAAANVNWTM